MIRFDNYDVIVMIEQDVNVGFTKGRDEPSDCRVFFHSDACEKTCSPFNERLVEKVVLIEIFGGLSASFMD